MATMWYEDDGMWPSEIAELLHRDKSTLTRLLVKKGPRKKDGRPPSLTEGQIDRLTEKLEEMIKKANGEWPVTADMLKRTLRLKVTVKTILKALHLRGYWWHTMREKPLLTEQDIADRFQFALDHYRKPASYWTDKVHMVIDVKFFKIYLNAAARRRAAKEGTWGVFRKKGQGLDGPYVRPNKRLKWIRELGEPMYWLALAMAR